MSPFVIWETKDDISSVILAVHGYNDYSNSFEEPAAYLSQFGIKTFAFDLNGFGKNKNRGKNFDLAIHLEDIKQRLKILKKENPNKEIFILGESMGGALVLSLINQYNDLPIKGVILVAPAIWDFSEENFWKSISLKFFSLIFPNVKVSAKGLIKVKASNNVEMLEKLSQDKFFIHKPTFKSLKGIVEIMDESYVNTTEYLNNPQYDLLILLPIKDEIVPRKPFLKILDNINQNNKDLKMTNIKIYENHYHMILRDKKANRVLEDLKNWILNENSLRKKTKLKKILNDLQKFEFYHRLDK